jgi:hypothetical protein
MFLLSENLLHSTKSPTNSKGNRWGGGGERKRQDSDVHHSSKYSAEIKNVLNPKFCPKFAPSLCGHGQLYVIVLTLNYKPLK